MLTIRFQGNEYVFVGDSLDESGAIATAEDYRLGRCSYAHYYPDHGVLRFHEVIGTRDDIEVIGEAQQPQIELETLLNLMFDPSWPWGRKP